MVASASLAYRQEHSVSMSSEFRRLPLQGPLCTSPILYRTEGPRLITGPSGFFFDVCSDPYPPPVETADVGVPRGAPGTIDELLILFLIVIVEVSSRMSVSVLVVLVYSGYFSQPSASYFPNERRSNWYSDCCWYRYDLCNSSSISDEVRGGHFYPRSNVRYLVTRDIIRPFNYSSANRRTCVSRCYNGDSALGSGRPGGEGQFNTRYFTSAGFTNAFFCHGRRSVKGSSGST